jgi:CHASE2 domain-containing sensor protein
MNTPHPLSSSQETPREGPPTAFSGAQRLVDGKYRLEERLGEGALGVVYRAVHIGLEKSFAIKLLKTAGASTPAALARFRKEAVALGRLQHPHIVEVTDSGLDEPAGGVPYLVMELLVGVPLSEVCSQQGGLPLAQALPLLDEIASAIDSAHGAGILHRDLKPGNILVYAAGSDLSHVKVLDFGLAELLAGPDEPGVARSAGGEEGPPRATATGALPGTPLYAAPELIRYGESSRASDIYSFGVIAYELLGGQPPFEGTVKEVLTGHLEAEPPPLPLPPEVWSALRGTLQKDPALRPRSAGEVVRRLREGGAQVEQARWRATEVPRRVRLAAALAAALMAAGFVLPWPPLPAAERWISDLRVRTSPERAPDPRILLVTLDEPNSSPVSLADRADEIAGGVSRIFEAGARGVAIDYLLPAKWSASPRFADLLLRHPEDLTVPLFSARDGSLVGAECMDRLTAVALGPQRASEMFAFVNLDEDGGVVRRGRIWFRDRSGDDRLSWAARAARGLGVGFSRMSGTPRDFWIDTRIDWPRYERISWRQVPIALDRNPELFQDRLVLVGELSGSGDDVHSIPHRSGRDTAISGLALQALLVDTISAGLPVREPGKIPLLAIAALATALVMVLILCGRRLRQVAVWLIVGAGIYMALSLPLFWWAGLILPVTAPLLLVLVGLVLALALRRILPAPPEVPAP